MKLKKIIASILAICMVLSTTSFPVYAEEAPAITPVVATVDGVEYTDIQEAITAAAPKKTVEVVSDIVVDEWKMFWQGNTTFEDIIYIDMDGLTINGNGHTLTVNNIVSASNGARLFKEAKELNIKDWKIVQPEKLGGIYLVSGAIEGVTFNGGNGIFPGDGEIVIDKCIFNTDYHCIYSEEANDGLKVTNCELNAGENNVIFLRGNTKFTGNTVKSGLKVRIVEGSPVVSGNDFGDVVVKVYNNATATIEGNTINNIEIDEPTAKVNSTFGDNTLSEAAETTLKKAGVIEDTSVETAVAQIGDTTYTTLSEAIDAAQYGDTVTLLSDLTIESDLNSAAKGYFNIAEEDKITLDLGEKTINVTDNSTGNFILFYNYGDLTIKNGTVNLTSTNNREWNAESAIILNRGGNLTIESGTYTHNGGTDMAFVVDNSGNYYGDAITDIKGGTLTSAYIAIRNRMEQNSHGASGKATLNISGGTITATKRAVWAQAASTSETSPATGAINVTGGEVGLIDTARSSGAECMTTISGGTVAEFKGEAGELTVTENGTITGTVTILTASGEEVDYVVDENGVYVEAPEVNYVVKIGETGYATLAEALTVASAMTGDVTVEIYDKVILNQSLSGSYDSITFVGKDTDAEIYLDVQGYITATGKAVAFEDLKLSKAEGGFITNAGFMNVAFGVYDVTKVTYTDCTFANGAYASTGEVTYTGCTFYRSHDKYGLWAYGDADIIVDDCTFADYRGIKMYAEGAAKTTNLTVKDSDFSALTGKPAIVLTYGESVTLEGNTYSSTGVFELDLDGAPNGTPVTSTDKITCVNDNGACGVLVDGKIYTTVAQAAEVATEGSTVTLLHDSTETVELAEGVILDKNGYTAEDVTTKTTAVAQIGDITYSTLDEAIADANGETVTVLTNIVLTDTLTIPSGVIVTLDLNGKEVSMNYTDDSSANHAMIHNKGNLTILDSATGGKLSYKYSGADLGTKYSANTVTTDFGSVLTVESGTIENLTYDSAIIAYAIDGLTNGNGGDVTININGGTITSQRQAIRIFANSITKTGYLNISGGEFTGRLIIQNANARANKAALNITGGIFNANGYKTDVLYVGGSNGAAIDMTAGVSVSGATFNGEISSSITTKFISGGTFSTDVSAHVADDYKLVKNENGTYGVEEKTGLSGAGTKEDPYLITNMDELKWFRDDVNAGNTYDGMYIKLTTDINLNNEEWTPIGTSSNCFKGMFDGNNHTISNLYINWSTEYVSGGNNQNYVGLFGRMNGAGNDSGIKNLTIENTDISGCLYVGAVLGRGYTSGIIENCHVTGNVDIEGYSYIGGIVGRYEYSTGTTTDGTTGVSIYNCSVKDTTTEKGTINGLYEGATYIGGILGFTSEPNPVMCFEKLSVENISVTGFSRVGGISGIAHQANIYKACSVSKASIYGTDSMVGLIVGACQGTQSSPVTFTGNTVDAETKAYSNETEVSNLYGTNISGEAPVTNFVARVGRTMYETLADALAAASASDDTITLISDVVLSEAIIIPAGADVTLDLNGKIITYNSTVQGEAMITNKGTLEINDTVGTGVINYNYTGAADPSYGKGNYTISNGGTLTVNGGKITIANLRAHAKYPIDNNSTTGDAILVINGGHLYNYNTSAIRQFCNSTTYQNSVTINGGLIEGYSAIWVQNPGSKTVNGILSITGGEIRTTAAAYVNGSAELKDVSSAIYCTIASDGGAWDDASAVSIIGGTINENVYLVEDAPAAITVDKENATFNGYVEIPASDTGLSGSGTAEDPYLITNIKDLKWFRDDVNAGNTYDNEFVKLTTDIDLAEEAWTPIGNGANKFLGTFDGGNYTISNLKVDIDANHAGFFGFASVIKNLKIKNATVSGVVCVGSVVGELESSVGLVENCHVTGTIQITGENSVGGLAGKGYANIKDCSVDGNDAETSFVLGEAGNTEEGDNVGGIIGHLGEGNTLGVANSTAKNITVKGTRKIGGIVGTTARANDYTDNTVENLIIESTATAEYANENASTTTIGGIIGNYFGSATSGGILKNSTVKNVTFNVGNAKSAGALAGGDRVNNGGEPVGIEVADNIVENVTGTTNNYLLPAVAQIGDKTYTTLAEALSASKDGDTIELISGDQVISAAGAVYGNKTVTITGKAIFDWSQGWLFVGRGGEGDGKLIFDNATITSTEASLKNGSFGIHVSAPEKGSTTKNNGTVVFKDSTIDLSYLANRGTVEVDGGKLNVAYGFWVGGRPSNETPDGVAGTATMDIKNGAVVTVANHNGMGIGHESIGIVNVDGATFEYTGTSFVVREGSALNIKSGTFKANKFERKSGGIFSISGNSQVCVEDFSGAARLEAGTTLNDSYIKSSTNGTARAYGDLTLNGGFEAGYFTTASQSLNNDTVYTGTVTIEDGTTLKASYGVEINGNATINGGTIELSGGNASGSIWGFVVQYGTSELNCDIVVNGAVGEKVDYTPIHFTYATATVNGNITQSKSGGEPIYITNSTVTLTEDASMTTDCAVYVNDAGTLKSSGNIFGTIKANANNAVIEISGGTYTQDVNEWCVEGYVALPDLNEQYVVGEEPTATINNLGAMTIPADKYTIYGNGNNSVDMPLNFVMQFLADQTAADMENSPFADWYGDFVITITGLEDDSFAANGCYLAGYYGDFGWVQVPIDGMTIKEGVRYPVMLGVGFGQKYDYICTGVKDFRCAMYLTEEILAANPNLEVKLELSLVDNSQGPDAALNAISEGETIYEVASLTYNVDDFLGYVASVIDSEGNVGKHKTLEEALRTAKSDDTVVMLTDAESSLVLVTPGVTLDLNGYSLTSDYVTSFGNIVDTAVEKGTLIVPADCIHIYKGNEYLPAKNNGGYQFFKVKEIKQVLQDNNTTFKFLPYFEETLHEILLNGQETTGITINVRLSWTQDQGVPSQDFVYYDEIVNNVIKSYDETKENYGRLFTLTVTGTEGLKDLCYEVVIISDTGVEIASEKLQVQTTVNE